MTLTEMEVENQLHDNNHVPESVSKESGTPLQEDGIVKEVSSTLALIKPDAMTANHKEAIIQKIKENGFKVVQGRQLQLSKEEAGLFYKEHEGKPFYEDLTTWMSSAPIYALVLEKEDAVSSWRKLMGPTNSVKAREEDPKSIRALYGTDGSHNATHGSDSAESAKREIDLVFKQFAENVHITEVHHFSNEIDTLEVCKPDAVSDESTEKTAAIEENEHTTENVDAVKANDLSTGDFDTEFKEEDISTEVTETQVQANVTEEVLKDDETDKKEETQSVVEVTVDVKVSDSEAQDANEVPQQVIAESDDTGAVKTTESDVAPQIEVQVEPEVIVESTIVNGENVHETVTEKIEEIKVQLEPDVSLNVTVVPQVEENNNLHEAAFNQEPETTEQESPRTDDVIETKEEPAVPEIKEDTEAPIDKKEEEKPVEELQQTNENATTSEESKDVAENITTTTIPLSENEEGESNNHSSEPQIVSNVVEQCKSEVAKEAIKENNAEIDNAQTTVSAEIQIQIQHEDPKVVDEVVKKEEHETAQDAGVTATETHDNNDKEPKDAAVEVVVEKVITVTAESNNNDDAEKPNAFDDDENTVSTEDSNKDASTSDEVVHSSAETDDNKHDDDSESELPNQVVDVHEKAENEALSVDPSSVTTSPSNESSHEKQVQEVKKTVNKKLQLKPKKSPGVVADKKVPATLKKKPVLKKEEESAEKTHQKTVRVPRVAMLAHPKKEEQEQTEEKKKSSVAAPKKKATSTKSLVSRLTAPTAASARKNAADAPVTTTTPLRKKKEDSPPKKTSPTSSSAAAAAAPVKKPLRATTALKKPTTEPKTVTTKKVASTEAKAATTKTNDAKATIKRITPPNSTPTKKVHTTTKRPSKVVEPKSTPASSKIKAPTATTTKKVVSSKKPVEKKVSKKEAEKAPEVLEGPNQQEAVVAQVTNENDEVAVDQVPEEQTNDVHESIEKQEEISESVHEDEETVKIVSEEEDKETIATVAEQKDKETIATVTEEEDKEIIATVIEEDKETVKIVTEEVSAKEEVVNKLPEEQGLLKVAEQPVEPVKTNSKPQMASLRSRFENFNNNNELQTTRSKETRSKSPNRISDMINRFTTPQ